VPASLPTFSSGLKLTRYAVFVMLVQIIMSIVTSIKLLAASTPDDARSAMNWLEYVMIANLAATAGMFVGALRTVPEFKRVRMPLGALALAALGFGIATGCLAWTYHVLSRFVDLALSPDPDFGAVMDAAKDLASLNKVAILKDLGYGVGLYMLIRTVQRSAAINDQLALRDEAGSMSRALLVMIIADLFWQLTYGLGESTVGITGFLGSLLIGVYWIYCHVRLQRFLYNASWFVNEPHNLPAAIVVLADDKPSAPIAKPPARPSQPLPRPSQPAQPAQPALAEPPKLAVIQPPPRVEPPRAQSASDGEGESDGPRFLR
jgi:hypothetical protein